jgi:hypothetical protein
MENELYNQVLLDAKLLRKTSIANAKAALTEAFEPKIQELLNKKLSEELQEESEADMEEVLNQESEDMQEESVVEESDLEESELDEILRELDALSEEDDVQESADLEGGEELEENFDIEEAEDDETEEDDEEGETEDEEGSEEAGGEVEEPVEVTDETEVVELTVGDLKRVFQDLVAAGETSGLDGIDDMEMDPAAMGAEDDLGGSAEDDLSLDEILAELSEEDVTEQKEEKKNIKKEAKGQVPGYGKVGGKGTTGYDQKVGGKGTTGYDQHVKQLKEANKIIKVLSEEMSKMNLLNAKLLFMNKIFKAKSLQESEKVKVVNAFDRATTVKEVKNTFQTLNESLSTKKKSQIKESMGFASKPAGVAPKKSTIVDMDPVASRWNDLVFGRNK